MVALQVQSLLFVSYSGQSTVVLKATFDDVLWNKLWSIASDIYPSKDATYPKRLHPKIKPLRKEMERYTSENVFMLCEVPSANAILCNHNSANTEPSVHHHFHVGPGRPTSTICELQDLQSTIHKASECIKTAWHLCRCKASEVLVFLIANLDRVHKPDMQHTVPIAYAFKGYSLKTEVMRNMIERVLNECYQHGLYTPVISFDGQWYCIAVRDKDGKPLTVLQLQKDTFSEAKRETKASIVHKMFSANVLHCSNINDVIAKVDITYNVNGNGHITSPIHVGRIAGENVFLPSKEMSKYIKTEVDKADLEKGKRKTKATEEEEDNESCDQLSQNYILSSLPPNVIEALPKDIVDDIQRIESTINRNVHVLSCAKSDTLECLSTLFEETTIGAINTTAQTGDEMAIDQTQETSDDVILHDTFTLHEDHFAEMLNRLQNSKDATRWGNDSLETFKEKFTSKEVMLKSFRKRETHTLLEVISQELKESKK